MPPPSHPQQEEEPLGPVTKLAAAAALSHLEQLEARRSVERETILATAARVGETALVLSRMRSGGMMSRQLLSSSSSSLSTRSTKEEMDAVTSARARMDANSPRNQNEEEDGEEDRFGYAFGDSCCDSPKSHDKNSKDEDDDAGIIRAKFSPSHFQQDVGDKEDSDGSDWNEEYLRHPPTVDRRYLQSLRKGRHPLRCTNSISFDASDEHRTTCQHDGMRQYPSISSDGRKSDLANSDSIMGSSSSSESNMGEDNDNGGKTVKHSAHLQQEQQHQQQQHGGGGIFESAKNWLQSQREKLARLELERQVEDQRRKLVEEGRRRRILEAERRRREEEAKATATMGKAHSASSVASAIAESQNMEQARDDSIVYQQQPQEMEEIQHNNNNSNYHSTALAIQSITSLCGITTLDDGDDDEYTDMTHIDSSGQQLLDMVCSTDQEYYLHICSEDDYLKVGSPRNTVSGMGMSVNVDLPPDDLHDGDQTCPRQNDQYPESDSPHDNSHLVDVKIVYEPPTLVPPILCTTQMESLIQSSALPPSLDYCKWERIYSLSRDGDSFDTFLRNVEGRDRTVLVVKTTLGDIFGGYADTRWEVRGMYRQGNEFYGTGQACLFRFVEEEDRRERAVVYKWSGANRYIQLCDAGKRIIAFGGGGNEGVFGLCIEDDFRRGTTGQCETFQNEPLCEEGYFDVMDLEVWGFTLDF
ncbi:hypothetical protein HJC23_003566 [Cyclotella cryptica]|uniref:Oxidation resistance protein 1 n=1 Tax=Cyclotella cryptica TaxID=29204 RepID=A0ABD3PJ86_9STRA